MLGAQETRNYLELGLGSEDLGSVDGRLCSKSSDLIYPSKLYFPLDYQTFLELVNICRKLLIARLGKLLQS